MQCQIPLSINPHTKDTVYLKNDDIRTVYRSSLLQPTVLHKTILGNLNFPSLLQLTQLIDHQIPVPRPRCIKIKLVPKGTLTVLRTQRLVERIGRDENNPRDLPLTSPRVRGRRTLSLLTRAFATEVLPEAEAPAMPMTWRVDHGGLYSSLGFIASRGGVALASVDVLTL